MAAVPTPQASSDEWADYWRGAALDGCTSAFPDAAAAGIVRGWRALFATLPPGTRLLDVACGRGALLEIAREVGVRDGVGVDVAYIDDVSPAILSGVDAADLPFADRAFDVAASQFGVEYAGLFAAGAEAARVAARHLWLLLHAAEGPVAAHALEQADQADWLRHDLDAFGRLARHAADRHEGSAADVGTMRDAILARADRADNVSLLEGVWQAAGRQLAAPNANAVAALAGDVAAYGRRLRLMAGSAPDSAATQQLATLVKDAGWNVTVRDEGPQPIARWLIADRNKGD